MLISSRPRRVLVLVSACVAVAGCGGSGFSHSGPRRISAHDAGVLTGIRVKARHWNRTTQPWSAALASNDRKRFLRINARVLPPMNADVVAIERAAPQIEDPRLREYLVEIGRDFRAETDGYAAVGAAVKARKPLAESRAAVHLEKMTDRKNKRVDLLERLYPELGSG